MFFRCLKKITDDKVINCLSKIKGAEGSIAYLSIIKSLLIAFVNEDTSDLDRIFHAIYVVYFLRIWRQFLKDKKISKKHFITQPSYEGLEIDLVLLVRLIIIEKIDLMPEICTQLLEKFFRKIRSYSPMESLMATCSLKGFMSKLNRIQLEEILLEIFKKKYENNRGEPKIQQRTKLSTHLVDSTMKRAINRATEDSAKLGMTCEDIELERFFSTNFTVQNENEVDYGHKKDYLNAENDQIDLTLMDDFGHETVENLNMASIEYTDISSGNFVFVFLIFKLSFVFY